MLVAHVSKFKFEYSNVKNFRSKYMQINSSGDFDMIILTQKEPKKNEKKNNQKINKIPIQLTLFEVWKIKKKK